VDISCILRLHCYDLTYCLGIVNASLHITFAIDEASGTGVSWTVHNGVIINSILIPNTNFTSVQLRYLCFMQSYNKNFDGCADA